MVDIKDKYPRITIRIDQELLDQIDKKQKELVNFDYKICNRSAAIKWLIKKSLKRDIDV